jgi:hypothetical protein
MKCPTCGSVHFYARDPEDEYEEYRFSLQGEEILPETADALAVIRQSEAFCERCSWHGPLGDLEK